MKRIQKFEKFNIFRNRNRNKDKNLKSELDGFLKRPTSDFKSCDISVKDDSISASFFLKNYIHTFLIMKNKLGNYEISKFDEKDTFEISEKEFNEYVKVCKKISDELDEESENEKSSIDKDGNLNLEVSDDEIERMEITDKFNNIFKEYTNKTYEFEIKYHKVGGIVIDRYNVKVKEVVPMPYYGKEDPSITADIVVDWNNWEYKIHITETTKIEYFDLEKANLGERGIMMFYDDSGLSRKEKREYIESKNKPPIAVECSPSKYSSIEFLSKVKEIIVLANEELSNQ